MTDAKHEAPAEGAGEADVLVTMRDHYQYALTGPWPDIKVPNYALAGLFKMAGDEIERLRSSAPEAREGEAPVAVTIFCPQCSLPHIDEGEWATTRHHKTHQCQGCGHEWRPFPFATVGVTHPAAPSADKLRIAVEALDSAREDLLRFACARGSEWEGSLEELTEEIDQALAALKAEG